MASKGQCMARCTTAVSTETYPVRVQYKQAGREHSHELRVPGKSLQEGVALSLNGLRKFDSTLPSDQEAKLERVQVLTGDGTVTTDVACLMPCQTPKDPPIRIYVHELTLVA